MIVHDYRIPYKLGETKRILMMSDIHYGNTQCDERAAKKKLNEDPEQYILLNGDQCDAIVLGDKRYTKDTDSTKGPAIIDEQVNELSEWLMPHRNRIIGIAD